MHLYHQNRRETEINNMGKRIYLGIIYSITAICIIIGIIINVWDIPSLSWISDSFKSKKYITYTENLEAFDNLDIDTSLGNVNVVNGTSFSIEYKGNASYCPEYSVNSSTLKITQPDSGNKIIKNIHLKNVKSELTITIPSDVTLTTVNCDINFGNSELTGINGSDITSHVDMGNLTLSDCSFSQYNIDTNMGNIDINRCSFDTMHLGVDMGNASVKLPRSDAYGYNLETDMGNVNLYGTNYKRNCSYNTDAEKMITAKVNMGNVDIYE